MSASSSQKSRISKPTSKMLSFWQDKLDSLKPKYQKSWQRILDMSQASHRFRQQKEILDCKERLQHQYCEWITYSDNIISLLEHMKTSESLSNKEEMLSERERRELEFDTIMNDLSNKISEGQAEEDPASLMETVDEEQVQHMFSKDTDTKSNRFVCTLAGKSRSSHTSHRTERTRGTSVHSGSSGQSLSLVIKARAEAAAAVKQIEFLKKRQQIVAEKAELDALAAAKKAEMEAAAAAKKAEMEAAAAAEQAAAAAKQAGMDAENKARQVKTEAALATLAQVAKAEVLQVKASVLEQSLLGNTFPPDVTTEDPVTKVDSYLNTPIINIAAPPVLTRESAVANNSFVSQPEIIEVSAPKEHYLPYAEVASQAAVPLHDISQTKLEHSFPVDTQDSIQSNYTMPTTAFSLNPKAASWVPEKPQIQTNSEPTLQQSSVPLDILNYTFYKNPRRDLADKSYIIKYEESNHTDNRSSEQPSASKSVIKEDEIEDMSTSQTAFQTNSSTQRVESDIPFDHLEAQESVQQAIDAAMISPIVQPPTNVGVDIFALPAKVTKEEWMADHKESINCLNYSQVQLQKDSEHNIDGHKNTGSDPALSQMIVSNTNFHSDVSDMCNHLQAEYMTSQATTNRLRAELAKEPREVAVYEQELQKLPETKYQLEEAHGQLKEQKQLSSKRLLVKEQQVADLQIKPSYSEEKLKKIAAVVTKLQQQLNGMRQQCQDHRSFRRSAQQRAKVLELGQELIPVQGSLNGCCIIAENRFAFHVPELKVRFGDDK